MALPQGGGGAPKPAPKAPPPPPPPQHPSAPSAYKIATGVLGAAGGNLALLSSQKGLGTITGQIGLLPGYFNELTKQAQDAYKFAVQRENISANNLAGRKKLEGIEYPINVKLMRGQEAAAGAVGSPGEQMKGKLLLAKHNYVEGLMANQAKQLGISRKELKNHLDHALSMLGIQHAKTFLQLMEHYFAEEGNQGDLYLQQAMDAMNIVPAIMAGEVAGPIDPQSGVGASLKTQASQQYAQIVAKKTGLDPNVVAAWVGNESAWGSSQMQQQSNNYLNMMPGGHEAYYPSVTAAAQAAINNIMQNPAYKAIRAAIKSKDPRAQIIAIENSPWAAGHYGYNLMTFYNEVLAAAAHHKRRSKSKKVTTTRNPTDLIRKQEATR